MRNLLLAAVGLSPVISAQTFVYYKFDSPCTTEVVNFADGPSSKGNGVLEENSGTPWVTGQFGGALSGGVASTTWNRVRSSWVPSTAPMTGDITIAFWAKLRTPFTSTNYLNGTSGSGHRLFTGGAAGTGLLQRSVVASGPNGVDAPLPGTAANFQALTAAGWAHFALVVDATAATATWFVNGTQAHQIAGVGPGLINSTGNYLVGQWASSPSNYDLDEWILDNRAYSAAEVLALSLSTRGADAAYTSAVPSQCGAGNATLGSTGGEPAIGNLGYGLTVTTTTTSLYVLLAGFDRCTFNGSIPLPLDGTPLLPLLAGCWIVADAPITLAGISSNVPTLVPLPIPSGTPAVTIYTQVLALDGATFASSMSNGFASSIGH
jgi:hypothetical protein